MTTGPWDLNEWKRDLPLLIPIGKKSEGKQSTLAGTKCNGWRMAAPLVVVVKDSLKALIPRNKQKGGVAANH